MRFILMLLVPPILLFCFALIAMWLPLPSPFPPALSTGRNQVVAAMTGILGAGYVVGLMVYLISSLSRSARFLDPVLVARGLTSQRYLLFGRQYLGLVKGREIDVQFTPSRGLQPNLLQMYVSADLHTRVAIGARKPLLDCTDCTRIEVSEPDLSQLQVFAQEEMWVHRLLADPATGSTLQHLMRDPQVLGFREVYIQPGQIWLRAHPASLVTDTEIGQWLDELLALAAGAERIDSVRSTGG